MLFLLLKLMKLLEMVTLFMMKRHGKIVAHHCISHLWQTLEYNVNLAEWAMKQKRNRSTEKIIDPKLVGCINIDSMNKYVEAAGKCLAEYGVVRPSMGDVLWNFKYALQLHKANSLTPLPQVDKIYNNLAMAASMLVISEALALGQNLGISATTL